jgi:lipoate-protein ligase B
MKITFRTLGRLPYEAALVRQAEARARVLAGGADEFLFLEHLPVVTLGRRGGVVDREALRALKTPVVVTRRGGQATWHGPGQIVAYPIVDLDRRKLSVRAMVDGLGLAMVQACGSAGLDPVVYECARPGVFHAGRKLGAIGLHIHRGVTSHGLALNVSCELAGFHAIEACGDPSLTTTTLALELGREVPMDGVLKGLRKALSTFLSPDESGANR